MTGVVQQCMGEGREDVDIRGTWMEWEWAGGYTSF
jgi:hypothetical protein